MKTGLLLLIILCVWPCAAFAQNATVAAPELRNEILEMTQKDQEVQMVIMRKSQAGETVDAADWARKDSVFLSHIGRAKEILGEKGWPGFDLVGEDGSQGMFLIVQHADADPAFQKKALGLLKASYEKGQASGEHVAYLVDRVRVAEGRPQVYGTQLEYDDRACPYPGKIENEAQVDSRRAKVGLDPLDEYIASSIILMGRDKICGDD